MKLKILPTIGLFLICGNPTCFSSVTRHMEWQKVNSNISFNDVQRFCIHDSTYQHIAIVDRNNLYISDMTDSFLSQSVLWGAETKVNDLWCHPDEALVYVATNQAAYRFDIIQGDTTVIYQTLEGLANKCLSIVESKEKVVIGTSQGFLISDKRNFVWKKLGNIEDQYIYQIEDLGSDILFLGSKGLFFLNVQRGDVQFLSGDTVIQRSRGDNQNSSLPKLFVLSSKRFAIVDKDFMRVWEKTNEWKIIKTMYSPVREIIEIGIFEHVESTDNMSMIVATQSGVFIYTNDEWIPMYTGLNEFDVRDVSFGGKNRYMLATKNSLWKLKSLRNLEVANGVLFNSQRVPFKEPSIQEVQNWAIQYANVHPSKIDDWIKALRRRAWMPDLSIGMNGGRDWSRSDSLWGSSSSGGVHHIGPDDKSSGEDLGWDVSFSWDLGDVLWSSGDISIDTRSKLMVELRDDIINQVTRLYFERKRLQIQLMSEGYQKSVQDELRMDELVALIDGLTGGKFGKSIRRQEKSNLRNDNEGGGYD